ncbi:MAG: methyltransferase [Pseudomonadota bacterium]
MSNKSLKILFKKFNFAIAALILAIIPQANADHGGSLAGIIDARSDEVKARDEFRHPLETLELFGIEEGMTVVDALPGSWYGEILAAILGPDGNYVGVRYGEWFYENRFGDEAAERWAGAQSFLTDWPATAAEYAGEKSPSAAAYFFPGLPGSLDGTVDAALFIRALHHTNRFESKYLDLTAADAYRVLKSGGIAGVVQHRAPEDADDAWAQGQNGYLKQSRVIAAFKDAGFVLENASEINANRKDQPSSEDRVWRLQPSSDSPEAIAIGESDRMTLVFRKP